MVNKHKAVQDWLAACPLLTDTLLFDFLSERNGSAALSPTAADAWVKQYIRGSGTRQYSFEIQALFTVSDSTDDTNLDNMNLMQGWMDWLEKQQAARNFPDFGPDCGGYRVLLPDSMPTQAMRYEGFAKYTFPAIVQYDEEKRHSKGEKL